MTRIIFKSRSVYLMGLIFLCAIHLSFGQGEDVFDDVSPEFISPVDHKIRLAGSFGELRSNHFHAGIDIKSSKGEEGDTIRATANGHISRIKIQRGGYGQVLYMDHPNGYTSVYAHLKEFADTLQGYIQQKQFENRSYEIDIYPKKGQFTFDQGEPVGLMGNTGRSYGVHLHFEIRETKSEVPENPYLHGIGPSDNRPPLIYAIEAHGLDNDHQKIWSKAQYVNTSKGSNYGPVATFEIPAWRTGLAIQTFDLMDGASNKNGVYSIEMYVDDSLYYEHIMDRVGFDVSKYINSHIDYTEKKKNNRSLVKCYVSPGNKLTFYPTIVNNGEVMLFKDKPQKVDFLIKDFAGNTSTYTCYVKRRDAKDGEIKSSAFQKYLKHGEVSNVHLGSCRFLFPANSFDKNTYISYREERSNDWPSFQLNTSNDPLFSYPAVSIPVNHADSMFFSKLVLVHEGKTSYGGHVENDSLRVRFGQFGNYTVEIDTVPPTIEVGSFLKSAKGKPFFRFAIYDNFDTKGYAKDVKYDVFIDGEWVIASLKALGNTLIVPLDGIPSGSHTIKIRVEDHCKNVNTWERTFTN